MNWHEYVPEWVMFHCTVVNFNPDPVVSDEWCQNLLFQSGWEDAGLDLVLAIICALRISPVVRSALVPSKSTWSAPCSSSSQCRCMCPHWWHLPQLWCGHLSGRCSRDERIPEARRLYTSCQCERTLQVRMFVTNKNLTYASKLHTKTSRFQTVHI